jgi:hypothetical protein
LGRLYAEARLIVLGEQLERASGLTGERPSMAAE